MMLVSFVARGNARRLPTTLTVSARHSQVADNPRKGVALTRNENATSFLAREIPAAMSPSTWSGRERMPVARPFSRVPADFHSFLLKNSKTDCLGTCLNYQALALISKRN